MRMTLSRAAAFAAVALAALADNARADQVIPDDLIVQGSLCVGFDCVNNENFGSDTIILKENQLRIFFLDTSAAGFPSNDWRLIANDANGSGNLFAIEDSTAGRRIMTLTAGAASNSIFVDSIGRVGFRTAAPVLDLHVNTSNTPALRFEQNNSGGFSAQTWDVAGNEANFFVRDVTGGSKLSFRIRPGAPTSSLDIAASGNVGLGTASPGARLDVQASGSSNIAAIFADNKADGLAFIRVDSNAGSGYFGTFNNYPALLRSTTQYAYHYDTNNNLSILAGGVRLDGVTNCGSGIVSNGSGTLSCLASSRQFKTVTGDLAPSVALANVMALRPQTGSYKDTPDVPEHWFIAEEVGAVDPALIGLADGKPYVVKTHNVVADLVAVVQQQQREIDELKRKLKK
ncbi:MAG TPA: tail fiber domain-containing protein [Xanthobacteraceae bacterium]|nr:tail fiber domain-containing protein [Xanthobacteraceae bacterium]